MLLRFIAPDDGSVRIGDRQLTDLDPDAWLSRLAWMPQRPHLFAGSIAENIALPRPGASHDELLAAADAAGLGELLARRPGGLLAPVGERAAALSAGERQRLALARLFLQEPLVLLDEPTANLDGATEDEVLAAVKRLARDRTVIGVAHRPALIALADRVADLSAIEVPRVSALDRGADERNRLGIRATGRFAVPSAQRLLLACVLGAAALGSRGRPRNTAGGHGVANWLDCRAKPAQVRLRDDPT